MNLKNKITMMVALLFSFFILLFPGEEIFKAAAAGDKAKVKEMLSQDPGLIMAVNNNGNSLLAIAAYEGHGELVYFFIKKGILVNQKNKNGTIALHYAAFNGHEGVIKLLINHQAEINLQEPSGMTPLHLAVLTGKEKTAALLLKKGAKTELKNQRGWTPLHLATSNGKTNIARLLIDRGADINVKDRRGQNPLQLAVKEGKTDLVKLFLARGADIGVNDPNYKRGLLHVAALNGFQEITELLIKEGIKINQKDGSGNPPLYYAQKYGQQSVAAILKANGAEPVKMKTRENSESILNKKLKEGEAYIWYLGHSGWAIKTQNHFLVFDYWKTRDPHPDAGLVNGYIVPNQIKNQNVFIFVSHGHGDHYDRRILKWEGKLNRVAYIWGWPIKRDKKHMVMEQKREKKELNGMTIHTICHQFDRIPESAFLIELDGLAIFHSGDHGNGPPPLKKEYTDNIDYLSGISKIFDIIFLPIWGEEYYPIQKLKPQVMFPMHEGGAEYKYAKWAKENAEKYTGTQISFSQLPGDIFYYINGKIKKL